MSKVEGRRYVPHDTSGEAYDLQNEAYRRMGGRGRAAVMFRLGELARSQAEAGIRARHPEYDQAQVRMALARLVLGDELCGRIWPGRYLVDP